MNAITTAVQRVRRDRRDRCERPCPPPRKPVPKPEPASVRIVRAWRAYWGA